MALTLADAVDILAEAQFYGRKLPRAEQDRAAALIVSRQGGVGAYAGSFALNQAERDAGIRVFTGELMTSASARHIIGEESCRVLRGLKGAGPQVKKAAKNAEAAMASRFIRVIDELGHPGTFCGGKCTAALWRNIATGSFGRREERLKNGVARLKKWRDGKGGWNRYPFHYTLLALTELGPEIAGDELKYAAAICERRLRRKPGKSVYGRRRHDVMQRAVELLA